MNVVHDSRKSRLDKIVSSRESVIAAAERLPDCVARTLLVKLADLLKTTDLDQFAIDALGGEGAGGGEYLHQEKSLQFAGRVHIAARRAQQLKLDTSAGLLVLDIGAGPGFFCWAAKALGHTAVAIQPSKGARGINFSAFMRLFGIPQSAQFVKPQTALVRDQSLPEGLRFDMVTAFAITFNRSGRAWWTTKDYLSFLEDIKCNFLKPGGRVVLKFNNTDEAGTPKSVITYYEELGRMLAPFVAEESSETGFTLDLFREGAWSLANAVVLPQPTERQKLKPEVSPSPRADEQLRLLKRNARRNRRTAARSQLKAVAGT